MIKRTNNTDSRCRVLIACQQTVQQPQKINKLENWFLRSLTYDNTDVSIVAWLADGFAQFSCLDPQDIDVADHIKNCDASSLPLIIIAEEFSPGSQSMNIYALRHSGWTSTNGYLNLGETDSFIETKHVVFKTNNQTTFYCRFRLPWWRIEKNKWGKTCWRIVKGYIALERCLNFMIRFTSR